MNYDLRRAALVVCCVLAVVVAGSFFPAAGFGDYPDSDAVDSEYYETGGGQPGTTDDSVGTEDSTAYDSTERGDQTPTETETETDDDTPSEEETETERENGTPTETETEPGAANDDSGLLRGALVTLVALCFLGGIGIVFWRGTDPERVDGYDGRIPDGFLPRLRLRLQLIPQLTMRGAIGVSRAVPSALDTLSGTGRSVAAGLGAITSGLGRGIGTAALTLPSLLAASTPGLGGPFSLSGGFASLFEGVRSRSRSWSSRSSDDEPSAERNPDDAGAPEPKPRTIEEAWEAMVEELPARRRHARTPGEYARIAVERGLPTESVSRLTEAFRDVRYGGITPSSERTGRTLDAHERIERARRDGGDEE